jgi:hypothetical protein
MAQCVDVDKLLKEARREGYSLVLADDQLTVRWANLAGGFGPSIELSRRMWANKGPIIERLKAEAAESPASTT